MYDPFRLRLTLAYVDIHLFNINIGKREKGTVASIFIVATESVLN